jgi:polyhydroxyalkanoate synthesis regulator phasin
MKKALKALFIIGAAAAVAGLTIANRKKIKNEVDRLVKEGKLKAKEGREVLMDLYNEAEKRGKKIVKKTKSEIKKIDKKIRKKLRR